MANSRIAIVLDIVEGASTTVSDIPRSDDHQGNAQWLANKLMAIASGQLSGNIFSFVEDGAGTAGTVTITCTRAGAAGDVVTIAGIALTEGVDFLRGADDAACATNLGAAINAHPVLKHVADATVATNVVTLTVKLKGIPSNLFVIATSDDTNLDISAASPTNGASGTVSRHLRGHTFGKGT